MQLGDLTIPSLLPPMTAEQRAFLVAQAGTLPAEPARLLVDMAAETDAGKHARMVSLGIGAAVGAAGALVIAALVKHGK